MFNPEFPPIPWPVRIGEEWRGYWREYSVGSGDSGIRSRWRAVWLVIIYRAFSFFRRPPNFDVPFLMHFLSGGYF